MTTDRNNGYSAGYLEKKAFLGGAATGAQSVMSNVGIMALIAPLVAGGAIGAIRGYANRIPDKKIQSTEKEIKAAELGEFLGQLKAKRSQSQLGKETGNNERSLHI